MTVPLRIPDDLVGLDAHHRVLVESGQAKLSPVWTHMSAEFRSWLLLDRVHRFLHATLDDIETLPAVVLGSAVLTPFVDSPGERHTAAAGAAAPAPDGGFRDGRLLTMGDGPAVR